MHQTMRAEAAFLNQSLVETNGTLTLVMPTWRAMEQELVPFNETLMAINGTVEVVMQLPPVPKVGASSLPASCSVRSRDVCVCE